MKTHVLALQPLYVSHESPNRQCKQINFKIRHTRIAMPTRQALNLYLSHHTLTTWYQVHPRRCCVYMQVIHSTPKRVVWVLCLASQSASSTRNIAYIYISLSSYSSGPTGSKWFERQNKNFFFIFDFYRSYSIDRLTMDHRSILYLSLYLFIAFDSPSVCHWRWRVAKKK